MLNYTEMFHSIQGEGRTIGKNVVFLRLSGCNLNCWYCDSKISWLPGKKISNKEIIDYYNEVKAQGIVITGGEPTIQSEEIINLIKEGNFKHVEIETNGTNNSTLDLVKYVNQINVSPKLENSKNSLNDRYNKELLTELAYYTKVIFKFVITNVEDLKEVKNIIKDCNIDNDKVYLMPEGISRDEQLDRQQYIIDICLKESYNFSPRTHILIWDTKKGV